jgi:hypothetical protein
MEITGIPAICEYTLRPVDTCNFLATSIWGPCRQYRRLFYGRISCDIPKVDSQMNSRLHTLRVSSLRCKALAGGASFSLLFHLF